MAGGRCDVWPSALVVMASPKRRTHRTRRCRAIPPPLPSGRRLLRRRRCARMGSGSPLAAACHARISRPSPPLSTSLRRCSAASKQRRSTRLVLTRARLGFTVLFIKKGGVLESDTTNTIEREELPAKMKAVLRAEDEERSASADQVRSRRAAVEGNSCRRGRRSRTGGPWTTES